MMKKKNVDLDEPTSYLDHVYLGCTHHEYKPNETPIRGEGHVDFLGESEGSLFTFMAKTLDKIGKKCQAEGEAKMVT